LYGLEFENIIDAQAEDLDRRVFDNYRDDKWLYDVVTRRANIELMLIDSYWDKLDFRSHYKFGAPTIDVSILQKGFHRSEFAREEENSPYRSADEWHLAVNSLDDYLALIDRMCSEAKAAGAVCMVDDSSAYWRTLQFDRVPKETASRVFGRQRAGLSPQEIKAFQDFIEWYLAEMSAKYDMPFQIHTGYGNLQDSNPLLLLDMIHGNPKTKFSLFHGGVPWVNEIGMMVTTEMPRAANVWLDSNWMPTVSYSMAKQAFHQWLEVMPSNRIMWGCDAHHAEGIYAAAKMARRCLAEVLSEKIAWGNLMEPQALKIGRQIMRENALELYPGLKAWLWKNPAQPVRHAS
jgi:hypothetical protein